jgi:hypothetical protein
VTDTDTSTFHAPFFDAVALVRAQDRHDGPEIERVLDSADLSKCGHGASENGSSQPHRPCQKPRIRGRRRDFTIHWSERHHLIGAKVSGACARCCGLIDQRGRTGR